MFRPPASSQSRVLIASADADCRRTMADIVKAAELRAVGFIREPDQLTTRSAVSAPDLLLVELQTLEAAQNCGLRLAQLVCGSAMRVVVCGYSVPPQVAGRLRQEGVALLLDLASPSVKSAEGFARLLTQGLAAPVTSPRTAAPAPHPVPEKARDSRRKTLPPHCVVIGSSTGGPMALMTVIKALPADFPLPIAIVQHMPAGFTRLLAERLDAECSIHVVEAEEGMPFRPGTVHIAPGGFHMTLRGSERACQIMLNLQEPENSCRPAVDVLFRSSGEVFAGHQHAVILTGMGRDGCLGATQLYRLGCRVTVQDAATSTVWGMPGAVANAGVADDVLPIHEIAPHLLRCL